MRSQTLRGDRVNVERSVSSLGDSPSRGGEGPVDSASVAGSTSPVLGWRHPTMFAPMEGVSNPLFRRLLADNGGVGVVCTEFVRIAGDAVSPKHLRRQVERLPDVPLSVQVMGTHAELMAEAAGWIAAAGADIVDVNLGCPAPRVVRKGAGSAMLKDLGLLYDVLAAMRDAVPGLFSAKIRAGFDDASGVLAIAETVQRAGADLIVVHPRRRADFYQGTADWRAIALLKRELRIPVVGNGDCWYAADASRMRRETGCDAVMIGRPALRNPWIFRQIAELDAGLAPIRPSGADVVGWIDRLVTEFSAAFPGRDGRGPVGRVKEVLTYIGRAVDDGGAYRSAVLRLNELGAIVRFSEDQLGPLSPEQLDLDAEGQRALERSGSVAQ